jgi:hypothetical protein
MASSASSTASLIFQNHRSNASPRPFADNFKHSLNLHHTFV